MPIRLRSPASPPASRPCHPLRLLRTRSLLLLLSATLAGTPAAAQIQPYANHEGAMLPVFTHGPVHPYVIKDGRRRMVYRTALDIRAGSEFGRGFVTVSGIEADLDPLRAAPPAERAKPGAVRFRYRAQLSTANELKECYALLTVVTQGSLGIHPIPIGRLAPGISRTIEKELPAPVDAVASLHIFSEGLEVRSTLHPEPYDMRAFYTGAIQDKSALSALELTQFEAYQPHALSADGAKVATTRIREARQVLFVYDLEAMKLLVELPAGPSTDHVSDLHWISAHELVYIAREKGKPGLRLLDIQTGKTRLLREEVSAILKQTTGQPHQLSLRGGQWNELFFKYDTRTNKAFDLQEPSSGYYLFDRQGNARIRRRDHSDKTTYYVRATPESRWQDLDEIVRQPGLRFGVKSAEFLDRVAEVESLGPDGDTLYISSRVESDRFELAAFSLSEGIIKRTLAKHPRYDLTSSDDGIAQLLFARDSNTLLGFIYEARKPQVVWLDPVFGQAQRQMDATFPDHFNQPVDWTSDGSTMIYLSSSDRDPGTYYVFKPREPRLIPLYERGTRLKGKELAQTLPFEFTARDGEQIPAYLTRPLRPDPRPAPLIVHIHGGPMARDSWQFNATNQFFASRGYAVLQVNYRGSSGYGARFQNAGLRARLDTVVLDDIADGARHLIREGQVDPRRIAVIGASFGGWATYLSLIKYPELYRAGVATAAVSHWRKTLRDDRHRFDNRHAYTFWKSLLSRENFAEDEKFIDPYLRAGELHQPVLIMHGERDSIVHAAESKLMLEALRRHNPNVRARSFVDASHTRWSDSDRVIWLNEIAAFLEEHLSAPAEDDAPGERGPGA